MTDRRPDPESLLAVQRRRGRLKIYLGMAAGVGKTYAMLESGQAAKRRGEDVVLGYLEPHGRVETERLAEGLEGLPLRAENRGDATLREFDLDAALSRKPGLLLVDELAHTNLPSSRHPKRWQDIEELRDAGIDVETTMNVQHVESLNDVVASVTGVLVRETVPDSVLDGADEIELIDLPPEELRRRLGEGRVYPMDRVPAALSSFFRPANLVALRELALRRVAERVDLQARLHRRLEGNESIWDLRERIVVAIAADGQADRVVRAARRIAGADGELHAVWVDTPRQAALPESARLLASNALRLAESLGARTAVLSESDAAEALVRFAQRENATVLVVGKPDRPRWREILFGSTVDRIVRKSGAVDVRVVTENEEPLPAPDGPPEPIDQKGLLESLAVVGLATGIGLVLRDRIDPTNLAMLYVAATAWIAGRRSPLSAAATAVVGVLLFDFFLIPPYNTFAVSDGQYLLTFGVMLALGLFIASLSGALRRQSSGAIRRERRTALLYELARDLARARRRTEIGRAASARLRDTLDLDAAVLVKSRETGELFVAGPSPTAFESGRGELAVAQYALERAKPAGSGTDSLPGADAMYLPLVADAGAVGVLAIRARDGGFDPEIRALLDAVADLLASAVERANFAKDRAETRLAADRERLRSDLLASVSHDLRTPLAVIRGNAERLAAETDREEARTIASESERLDRRVRDLLETTRLQNGGGPALRLDWESPEEIVGAALAGATTWIGERPVTTAVAPELPPVRVDATLLELALSNLLENAVVHSPTGTPILIGARREGDRVRFEVVNVAPPLSEREAQEIFERGRRGSDAPEGGFGLGLAIVRSVAEAHGGRALAVNRPEHNGGRGGVAFIVEIPTAETAP